MCCVSQRRLTSLVWCCAVWFCDVLRRLQSGCVVLRAVVLSCVHRESVFSEVPSSLRDTERACGVLSDKRGVRIDPEVKERLASQKGTKTNAMEARGAKRISKCAPVEQIRGRVRPSVLGTVFVQITIKIHTC